ncbi:MAG: hypothetical protein HFJ05_09935 [Eubacterium sp.]|nr:hypothetical protein [Eubacterium sp.]
MKVSKLIKTAILILAITAALSCLQLCMRVHNVQISQRSNAHLFLEDGTEYADTILVELEGVYHYYPIHTGGNVDYIEIKAVASENEVEIFDALIVYNFLDRKWQWVMHNREEPEETQINQQAMFTNFNKKNRGSNASFLFCIDDISKITENGEAGQKGLLLVTTEEAADDPAEIVQSVTEDTYSGAADFIREYGFDFR